MGRRVRRGVRGSRRPGRVRPEPQLQRLPELVHPRSRAPSRGREGVGGDHLRPHRRASTSARARARLRQRHDLTPRREAVREVRRHGPRRERRRLREGRDHPTPRLHPAPLRPGHRRSARGSSVRGRAPGHGGVQRRLDVLPLRGLSDVRGGERARRDRTRRALLPRRRAQSSAAPPLSRQRPALSRRPERPLPRLSCRRRDARQAREGTPRGPCRVPDDGRAIPAARPVRQGGRRHAPGIPPLGVRHVPLRRGIQAPFRPRRGGRRRGLPRSVPRREVRARAVGPRGPLARRDRAPARRGGARLPRLRGSRGREAGVRGGVGGRTRREHS